MPVCLGIQANDEAVSEPVGVGRGERCGLLGKEAALQVPLAGSPCIFCKFTCGDSDSGRQPPSAPSRGTDFPLRALMEGSGQREAGRGRREREAGEGGGRRRWEKGGGRLVPQLGTGRPGSWPSSVANLLCDLGQVISPALSLSLLPLKL